MRSFPEARFILPIDLPLVRRLASQGVSFDSSTSLTRGPHTLEGAVWSALPLTDLGMPTFVMREGDNAYVAQFRHKSGEQHAHITFIAPDVNLYGESAWLSLLDAMTHAAGRRGAFTLNAEVSETGTPFVILREAGFAVYARQEIWKREPQLPQPLPSVGNDKTDVLRPATTQDVWAINGLYANVVPRLVLQADALPEIGHGGLVYESKGQILGYLLIQEGKYGLYVQSLLHPDAYSQSRMIIASLLARLPRAERLPLYWPVRRYQEWLHGPLADLGFDAWSSQAVMVKHTVYRLEQPALKTVYAKGMIRARTPVIDCIQNIHTPE